MTAGTTPEVRCRACGALDWVKNGFAISAQGHRVELMRYAASRENCGAWQCRRCGHELVENDPVAGALTQLQQVHWE